MGKEARLEIVKNIDIPCFSCYYAHSCKYFSNSLWFSWILANHTCPAFTYHYDSLYYAMINDAHARKRREEEQRSREIWTHIS